MNKSTIELQRITNFPKGYGRMQYPTENSPLVLDKLIEWSQENPNKKIYRHVLYQREENINPDNVYKCFRFGTEITREDYEKIKGLDGVYAIVYSDLVDYIDIYWQEK